MLLKKNCLFTAAVFMCGMLSAQLRWNIKPDGDIEWLPKPNSSHYDNIEMSGKKVSTILRYGVDENGEFHLERSIIWPLLRTIPNDTHASMTQRYGINIPSLLTINGWSLNLGKVNSIVLKGRMVVTGNYSLGMNVNQTNDKINFYPSVQITTTIFPSTDKPAICELYELKNITQRNITVYVPALRNVYKTVASRGVEGSYTIVNKIEGDGTFVVEPGKTIQFGSSFQAFSNKQNEIDLHTTSELSKRMEYVNEVTNNLMLVTPDTILNTAFNFAKIRASESIFETKGGLFHGPGGEMFYAAIWANDQAEYVNPFFPYLGYKTGNQSALVSYKQFARFINQDYKPIPSSIIAEGTDIWNGAGDRGDAAMIAYGASRYALSRGNIEEARELWPLIEWCLEYSKRKINKEGVVESDSDELENRFPSGSANLSTSCLYYDALISASYLAKELGKPKSVRDNYVHQAKIMRQNINAYFSATVEGFETYKYYKENSILRSWICMPLTVGIFDRAKGTIDALFSPRLWTKNGLLTEAGSATFWDRSTLYALRGIYEAGETEKATSFLQYYTSQRLLGEHVPYPIEAWPERNQRHLSAESGLYTRVITEGLFGLRPTGFKSFDLTPRLPRVWNNMELKNIKAFESNFNIHIMRSKKNIVITISNNGKVMFNKSILEGSTVNIKL